MHHEIAKYLIKEIKKKCFYIQSTIVNDERHMIVLYYNKHSINHSLCKIEFTNYFAWYEDGYLEEHSCEYHDLDVDKIVNDICDYITNRSSYKGILETEQLLDIKFNRGGIK